MDAGWYPSFFLFLMHVWLGFANEERLLAEKMGSLSTVVVASWWSDFYQILPTLVAWRRGGFNNRAVIGGIKIMTDLGHTYLWISVESLVDFCLVGLRITLHHRTGHYGGLFICQIHTCVSFFIYFLWSKCHVCHACCWLVLLYHM